MNLNRLRKLAGLPLVESVSDDPAINDHIEKTLAGLPEDQQSKYLDALEVLKNAKRVGLTGQEWMAAYRQIRGNDEDAKEIVPGCARLFIGHVLEKVGLKYKWMFEGTHEIEPTYRHAVEQHVDLTSDLMDYAKEMDTFSIRSLSRVVMNRMADVDPVIAQQVALQFIEAHRTFFEKLPNGDYRIAPNERPQGKIDYSSMFKDIARKALEK